MRPTLRRKYNADACVTLNTRTAPVVAFASRGVTHIVFLISLVIEQTSEDCNGNTEHSNINVNDECNIIQILTALRGTVKIIGPR